MSQGILRQLAAAKALAIGAVLVVAVSGAAYANTVSVTVKTPGATAGPTTTFSEISTHADCSSGLVSGGGIDQAIGNDSASPGNHVMGTEPSSDGSTEYTGSTGVVGTDNTHWLGIGGSGGAVNSSFSTTPYAVCFTSNLINHTQIVMNKAAGPQASSTPVAVTATCPANTVLLGGGARTTPANVGSLKPVASFPTFNDSAHDYGLKASADGDSNPNAWTSVGWNGGGGGLSNETYAYAICSGSNINVSGVTIKVHYSEVSESTGTGTVTVGCGTDGNLVSGGAAASGGSVTTTDFTGPGSGGDHLNGSYPSDSSGNPVSDGTTTASYWSSYIHAGGGGSANTYGDAWALCANDGV